MLAKIIIIGTEDFKRHYNLFDNLRNRMNLNKLLDTEQIVNISGNEIEEKNIQRDSRIQAQTLIFIMKHK